MKEKTTLQERAKQASVPQQRLAELLGQDKVTISRYLRGRGSPASRRHLAALVIALSIMDDRQRGEWERLLQAEPMERAVRRGRRRGEAISTGKK